MKYIYKTKWASIKITSSGSVILSLNSGTSPSCFYFESIDQFTEAIRREKIKVNNWIISVPDSLCITKSIELPATDTNQAHKMLEFELSSYLPIAVEELVYGCVPVSKRHGLLKVMVYILKIKTLEDILAKFSAIGIRPSRVLVDSVAIQSWFNQYKSSGLKQIELLFGKECLYISAVEEGCFRGYDKLSLQDNNFKSQREQIKDELNHFAAGFFIDKEQSVLKIAVNKGVQEELKNGFEENFNAIEFLELPQLNSFAKSSACPENEYIVESAITQGLLRAAEDSDLIFLNLLPRKTLKRAQQRQMFTNVAVSLAMGVLVIFSLWLNFAVMNWRIQRACHKINQEIAPIKHIAADVESKRQKVRAIQTQLANRQQISDIFSQLYKYSPKEISISQMSYSSKANAASVSIKGQSDTLSRAFEYSDAMKDSGLLNNIQIINAQQIPRLGGSVVEFKAECAVRGN